LGAKDWDFAVRRYLPNGTPDPTFGANGRVRTAIQPGASDAITGLAIQPGDGKIVAVGSTSKPNAAHLWDVVPYLPGGGLDPSFDGDGKLTTSFGKGSTDSDPYDVEVLPGGKLLVVGQVKITSARGTDFAIVRYLPSGALDTSFGQGGIVVTDFSSEF